MSLELNSAKIAQLKAKIEALPKAPTGSITITSNGTYDVKEKASAVVNVESSSSGGSAIAGITDLGAVTFVCDSSLQNDSGESVYEYTTTTGITLPNEFFNTQKYKLIIPFKLKWANAVNSSEELGIIEIGTYEDFGGGQYYINGALKMNEYAYNITPALLANYGMSDSEFPYVVDVFEFGDGTFGIDLFMLPDTFNGAFTNNAGQSAGCLTDELTDVHPLLISYDEIGNGGGNS